MVPKWEAKITFSILTCRSIVYTTWFYPTIYPMTVYSDYCCRDATPSDILCALPDNWLLPQSHTPKISHTFSLKQYSPLQNTSICSFSTFIVQCVEQLLVVALRGWIYTSGSVDICKKLSAKLFITLKINVKFFGKVVEKLPPHRFQWPSHMLSKSSFWTTFPLNLFGGCFGLWNIRKKLSLTQELLPSLTHVLLCGTMLTRPVPNLARTNTNTVSYETDFNILCRKFFICFL